MKKLLALLLSVMLCVAMLFTVACEPVDDTGDTPGNTASGDTGDNTGETPGDTSGNDDNVIVAGVSLPASIRSFISKSGVQTNKETEFFINSETEGAEVVYKVGDDNAFKFKPEVSYMNEDYEEADAPADESFTATVTTVENGVEVDASSYYTYNDVSSAFDFTEDAIGKTFTLKVRPNGLNSEQENNPNKFSVSFEVKVIDGYNAYEEEELCYVTNFDTINTLSETSQHYGWKAFREENGLTLDPNDINAVIMHNDMYLTKDVVPSSFFYTESNVPDAFKDRAQYIIGSVREDRHHGIYTRWVEQGGRFDFIGNYFTLDASQFPHVKIMDQDPTTIAFDDNGKIISSNVRSHFSIFRFEGVGRTTAGNPNTYTCVSDLYAVGNSPKEDDLLYSGGLMLVKTERVEMEIDNIINRCFFLTCMNQVYGTCKITNMKCYDAFNSPLYNWGSKLLYVDNCIIEGSGGPAVIVDAVDHTIGKIVPAVVMKNAVLDNPVYGSESWFVMANATALLPEVIKLNAVPAGLYTGLTQADTAFGGQLSGFLATKGLAYKNMGFATAEKKGDETVNRLNVYCVIKNDEDTLGDVMSAYVEINGNVLDYGAGASYANEITNAPAGTTDADYRTTLRGYVLNACRMAGAPLLESSAGGIVYTDGTNIYPAVNITGAADLQDASKVATLVNAVNFLNGETLNVYYHNSLFGTLGIMFEYNEVA